MANEITISLIICVHNAEGTICDTLDCIFKTDFSVLFEVIVVDDASTDTTPDICAKYDVKMIRLDKNQGPAKARNIGVRESMGDIIYFIDSDVTFPPDLLGKMYDIMMSNSDIAGVGSISSDVPLNPGFFSRYFALQENYMITTSIDSDAIDTTFYICTRCGTLKRSVFNAVGGFNESFRKASIEDFQFSQRLKGKYLIHCDKTLINNHHFPDTAGKLWHRYFRNTKEMYLLMKGNDIQDTVAFQSDTLARLLLCLTGLFCIAALWLPVLILCAGILFIAALIIRRGFLELFYKKEGLMFAIKGWLVYIVTTLPIALGTLAGMLHRQLNRNRITQ